MPARKPRASCEEPTTGATGPAWAADDDELSSPELQQRIAETAYFIAAARDFADGDPVQDWLEAEIMVHATLAQAGKS